MLISLLGFIIFIYSVVLHEIAHGFVADKLGDPTARISGRLTLNPIPHIDLVWSIIFPFFLFISKFGIIFGAAKPVPIDPYNLRNPRKDLGIIGISGPITNLLIAVILSIVARIIFSFPSNTFSYGAIQVLANAAYLNIALAIFNLIPIPPLDGSRVLASLLPNKYALIFDEIEKYGFFIIILLFLFPGIFFPIQRLIYTITNFILNFVFPGLPVV